jgi:hypothetical protein
MMPLAQLQQKLAKQKKKYEFRINNNRTTMLSVKWEPDRTKVSLHKMFLNAPENIMDQLACYLKQERKTISPDVRAFIDTNLQKFDYSWQIDPKKLEVKGNVYNLQEIYDDLNREYFDGKLNLLITWFGKPLQRNRSRVTFGLYHDQMRLIKINRIMDSPTFPDYVIAFVIYHEMIHHVCPAYYDKKGRHQVHSKEFKAEEQKFKHYDLATRWIERNQSNLFSYH